MTPKLKTTLLCASVLSTMATATLAAPLVTAAVDDRVTTTIAGERSPLLARAQDQGELAAAQPLDHVLLILKRPDAQQARLDKLVHDQQDRSSPSYHQWLAPSDLRGFGPDQADIDATVAWLRNRGLTVHGVAPSGMSIDFGGSAAAVAAAFHTSLHTVSLAGETHIANTTDLAIPAALSGVVRGATLSNFFPRPNMVRRPQFTVPNGSHPYYAVGPADFATIYNLNPLFSGGNLYGGKVAGAGVTVAVVEQTDISGADWQSFRRSFKLSGYAGKLEITHPGGCGDPGFTFDEGEAALDAEWSGATAPDATIIEAACPGTSTTFGVETTLQNLVERGTTASVLSISYGGDEAGNGLTFLAGWANLVEMGAAEGLTIVLSSGDAGVSAVRNNISNAGLAVNGLSTNAYNTTVGGTDFYDTALGQNAKYWRPNNAFGLSSAKSYVPEIPWDNSCASSVLWKFLGATDAVANCNVNPLPGFEQQGVGGTGGQSIYYAKPDFQKIGIPGMPTDGVRDQPDVSLFAANGLWSHFYVFCMSNPNTGGTSCDFSNPNNVFGNAAGGTSFGAPAFAGIMALVVQTAGKNVGNASPRLYALAKAQFNQPLLASQCNSTLGSKISSACVFNNVTVGNIAEPCFAGTTSCYTNAGATNGVGVLRAPLFKTVDAFPTQPGYSLATGLGTINVTNLLYNY